jgi:acyl-CoA synthetase (AMP-forming)/AMP-acid ligase II
VGAQTLLCQLAHWSEDRPDRRAYAFLAGGRLEDELSYAALRDRVEALGARLAACGRPGDRAMLMLPPGLDYVVAFLACLAARRVAVTAYAPGPEKSARRLAAILRDSRPAVVLCPAAAAPAVGALADDAGLAPRILHPESGAGADAGGRLDLPTDLAPDELALLQYTSGSTSAPKGVMVTHGNLLHNSEAIRRLFRHDADTRVVSWLPPFHDMGLVGGILQSLHCGGASHLMSPIEFLQRPHRWLQAISAHRATSAGGPDFAFRHCVERVKPEQMADVDLGSWRVAFNGAETVHASTLDAFADKFAPWGFRRASFLPCYGLAEATLLVSAGAAEGGAVAATFDRASLQAGYAQAAAAPGGQPLVGAGRAAHGQQVAIVAPDSRRECLDGEVGEICVAGTGVARGYWERPAETAQAFGLELPGRADDGRFLRTGDLGFRRGGELFVCGRLKDLIVLKGQNFHPPDIEGALHARAGAGRANAVAAFSLSVRDEEHLAVAQEVEGRAHDRAGLERRIRATRSTVFSESGVSPHVVFLMRAGSLPRTTSGKIQRQRCRDLLGAWLEALLRREPRPAPARDDLERQVLMAAVAGDLPHVCPTVAAAAPQPEVLQ